MRKKLIITLLLGGTIFLLSIIGIIVCFSKKMDEDLKTLLIGICSGFITSLIPLFTTEILNYIQYTNDKCRKRQCCLSECIFLLNYLYQDIKAFYNFHFDEDKNNFSWDNLINNFRSKAKDVERQFLMNNCEKKIIEKTKSLNIELERILNIQNLEYFNKIECKSLSFMSCYCNVINQLDSNSKQTMLQALKTIYIHADNIKEFSNYNIRPKLNIYSANNKELK